MIGHAVREPVATEDDVLCTLAALPEHHPSRPAVRNQVIEAWLPLASHLAYRFAGRGEPVQDLIQTAVVGLIKAVDRYDPTRGDEFAAFAVPTIIGEIKRYFRDQSWALHVPRRLQELRLAIAAARETLTQQLGHQPSIGELAQDLRLPEEEVREGIEAAGAYSTASLDAPLAGRSAGGPAATLADLLGAEDAGLALAELRMTMVTALAQLPERERRILLLRFFSNLTQDQIAQRVGISQMHVSRLLARTLRVLRQALADCREV